MPSSCVATLAFFDPTTTAWTSVCRARRRKPSRRAGTHSSSSLHDVPLALKRRWTQRSLVAAGNRVAGVEQIKCPAKTLEACWLVVLLAAVGVACCQGLQLLWCPRKLDLHFLALTRLQLGCPVGLARRMSRLLQVATTKLGAFQRVLQISSL
ncbi:uncharacterized protein LOC144147019 isoform X1 [Haemaphysalis longicornis]